jgi:hypothetical protein
VDSGDVGLVCSSDDVFALAGITDAGVRRSERKRIEHLIAVEPAFLWGDGFARHRDNNKRRSAVKVAYSVALKSGLISYSLHQEVIAAALVSSQFDAGSYSHIVRVWLDRQWGRPAAAAGGIESFLVLKGGFAHYDEVKDSLERIHQNGGEVRVLKGKDGRTEYVVSDLVSKGIAVRVHERSSPKIRLYICDEEYLYFVSLPERIFWGFNGSEPEVRSAALRVFEDTWSSARVVRDSLA